MPDCFCGCGLDVPFGRRRAANKVGSELEEQLALVRGALKYDLAPDLDPAELERTLVEGEAMKEQLRGRVHGTRDSEDVDKTRVRAVMREALSVRNAMGTATGFLGINVHGAAQLFATGSHGDGEILDIRDTGTRINDRPRFEFKIRVTPDDGGAPFEIKRKVTISRLWIPQVGDHLQIAYDPEDDDEVSLRRGDAPATAPAAADDDPVDELERLAALHASGALTDEEFAQAKARVLAGESG